MKKTILSIMLILPMISFSQDSINQKDEDQQHPRAEALRARLNAAVEKGTITQEQADKRYEGFMRKVESPDEWKALMINPIWKHAIKGLALMI